MFDSAKLHVYHAVEEPGVGAEHVHDEVQIAVPIRGVFHATLETKASSRQQQIIYPGSLLLTGSQRPHAIETEKAAELTVLWLPSSLIAETASELAIARNQSELQNGRVQDPLLHQISLSIVAALREAPSISRLYIDSAANLLAAHLLTRSNQVHPSGLAVSLTAGLPSETFRKVTDYIKDNLDNDISLADLSAVAGVSESRFGHLFRATTGQSPYQFVIGQRIELAQGLIASNKLSIGEIAFRTGFCDQSQFTRQFKKRVGLLPTEYADLVRF